MDITLMTQQSNGGKVTQHINRYTAEEYAEVYTAAQRRVLDAGEVLAVTDRFGTHRVVNMNAIALTKLGA